MINIWSYLKWNGLWWYVIWAHCCPVMITICSFWSVIIIYDCVWTIFWAFNCVIIGLWWDIKLQFLSPWEGLWWYIVWASNLLSILLCFCLCCRWAVTGLCLCFWIDQRILDWSKRKKLLCVTNVFLDCVSLDCVCVSNKCVSGFIKKKKKTVFLGSHLTVCKCWCCWALFWLCLLGHFCYKWVGKLGNGNALNHIQSGYEWWDRREKAQLYFWWVLVIHNCLVFVEAPVKYCSCCVCGHLHEMWLLWYCIQRPLTGGTCALLPFGKTCWICHVYA